MECISFKKYSEICERMNAISFFFDRSKINIVFIRFDLALQN